MRNCSLADSPGKALFMWLLLENTIKVEEAMRRELWENNAPTFCSKTYNEEKDVCSLVRNILDSTLDLMVSRVQTLLRSETHVVRARLWFLEPATTSRDIRYH
ncbi:hypothetical protein VTO42DRAFT_2604 [Malbranchea cinnamomea]